jgi:signal transduction histidine kinase/ligand-binding sensor domain-containing protein
MNLLQWNHSLLFPYFPENHLGIMRFRFTFWGLLLLLNSNLAVFAQVNPYLDFQFDIQKYTVDDGLPGNSINAVTKDDLGFIWVATAGGIARYDGHRFEIIPMPEDSLTRTSDSYASHIKFIKDLGIVVATKTGIYIYDIIKGNWNLLRSQTKEYYSYTPSFLVPFADSVFVIDINNNDARGLDFISKNGTFHSFFQEKIYDFHVENDTLWTISDTDVISVDKNFNVKKTLHNLVKNTDESSIYLLKSPFSDLFYAFTRSKPEAQSRVSRIYKGRMIHKQVVFELIETLTDSQSMLELAPNQLWISTEYGGLFVLDTKNNSKINVKSVPHFKPHFDQHLMRSLNKIDETLWASGNGTGLIKIDLRPKRFKKLAFGTQIGDVTIGNLIKTVQKRGDFIWLVNHNEPFGIQKIDLKNQTGDLFTFTNGPKKLNPVDLLVTNEHVFVGFVNENIWSMNHGGKFKKPIQLVIPAIDTKKMLTNHMFYSGFIDSDSTGVWAANRFQVFRFNNLLEVEKVFQFRDHEKGNFLWQMGGAVDSVRNGIWVTVSEKVLFIDFESGLKTYHELPELLLNDTKHIGIIKRNDVLNQNLWIAAENGLIYYEPETKRKRFYSTKNGLPDNFIYGILVDDDGDLWLSTNKGLSKAAVTVDNENLPVLTFRNFTVKDGLQSNEFNSFGYNKADDGTFWFSGVGGINWFHPDSIKDDLKTPTPVIKQVNVFNKAFEADTNYAYKKNYVFEYDQSDFSIEFTGITYRRSDEVTYAYQLVGQDMDWVESGKETRARYTNLSPGLYQFQVKAANYDGIWSEPSSIWIRVNAPFWLKSWFFVLVGMFVVNLIYLSVRYFSARKYKKLLQELEKREMINHERARIAKDLHDELGANLTQISLLSELVQREITLSGKTSTPLKKVAEAAKTGVTNLSEIVWSLNPKNDSLENVVAYIQEYADGYFNGSSIRVLFEIDESFPNKMMSSDVRHALLMTFKECLNNALKYSEATTIWIHIHFENDRLTIVIQENGVGFSVDEMMSKGNGIMHQLTRLKAFGGVVNIDTAPGKGCETRIVLPIEV